MDYPKLRLSILPQDYAIYSCPLDIDIPNIDPVANFLSVTWTPIEVTVVSSESPVLDQYKKSIGWKCIKVVGSFDFHEIGVLAGIAVPLAQSNISIYVISTYETDYILVDSNKIEMAVSCLTETGHTFVGPVKYS